MSGVRVVPDGRGPIRDRVPNEAQAETPPSPEDDPGSARSLSSGLPQARPEGAGRDNARVPPLSFRAPVAAALRLPILAYRYSLSMLLGRRCRYLPTCSEFADEAIARHGAWAGGWMAAGRVCRCNPWGGDGFDPVPRELPSDAAWSRPWGYARRARPICEAVDPG